MRSVPTAVGYEHVIREKEMAFDAQLSATEIVRRCERRVGQLVREGQEEGTIRKRGDDCRTDLGNRGELGRSKDNFANTKEYFESMAQAAVSDQQFDAAVSEARSEGNLSRANVVRKVKGEAPKPAERSEWHRKKRHIDSNRIVESLATRRGPAA
jgi:predicted ribosome quality control (RQC) complex YloA/Tae2 family protein